MKIKYSSPNIGAQVGAGIGFLAPELGLVSFLWRPTWDSVYFGAQLGEKI